MKILVRTFAAFGLAILAGSASAQLFSKPGAIKSKAPIVEVLDVGQGDAILIRSPEGKVALIDAGPSRDVVTLLKQRGVTSIDLVAVSHHHSDHYGGMSEVLRTYKPKFFLASDSSHTTTNYLKLLKLVKENRIQAIQPTKSARKIELGSIDLTILPQPPLNDKEENDNSIGIRLQYGTFSMLLTGDSEEAERRWWVQHNPELLRNCTVLKLAHHGSRNGTDVRWLELVKPKLAVASLAKGNDYHHPHQETVSLLSRTGIPFLRTDQVGTIMIRSDGKSWQVEGSKNEAMASRTAASRDEAVEVAEAPSGRRGRVGANTSPNGRVDVNRASEAELITVPGVGSTIAKEIIEGRPFKSVDDLQRVRGIGKSRLAQIREGVIVR